MFGKRAAVGKSGHEKFHDAELFRALPCLRAVPSRSKGHHEPGLCPTIQKPMKNSNGQCSFQALFSRLVAEIQFALGALRESESPFERELALLHLQMVIEDLEKDGA